MTTCVAPALMPSAVLAPSVNSVPYICYHRHSCVSNIILTDSVATNEDYARRAVELGHTVLSSCEHGTQGNYFQCAA